MKEAVKRTKDGEYKIDLSIAVKNWNLCCRICRHMNEYTLKEYTRKGRIKLGAPISKEDAEFLIKRLELRCVPSDVYTSMSVFLWV